MGESSTQSSSYILLGISTIDTLIRGSMPSEICDVKARFSKLQINCDMSCACCTESCKAKRSAEVCVRTAVPSQSPSTSVITSNQPSVVPTGMPSFIPSHRPSSTPGNEAALLRFYNDLDGPNWNFSNNWLTDTDFCTWTGVSCFGENVISLELDNKGLKGKLPSSIFTDLPMLETLSLEKNSISGKFAQSGYCCRTCWCVIWVVWFGLCFWSMNYHRSINRNHPKRARCCSKFEEIETSWKFVSWRAANR